MKRGLAALAVLAVATGVAATAFVLWPLPAGLLDYRPIASVRILDRDGGLLRELRSRADGRATPVTSKDIPELVKQAFLAAEDGRFYSHGGIDPRGVLRAATQDVRAGEVVQGGSTLTQQLARNLVPRQRTLVGKVQEALWALRLEAHLTKDEILTQYLNRVPFGNGTFGIEAAAQLYFGRQTRYLSLGQAAALASIPRGPTAYNPYRAGEKLRRRQRWVLDRMAALGFILEQDGARAAQEPLDLDAFSAAFRAPHFVEYVAQHLEAWRLQDAVEVWTSLDPRLQAQVEDQIGQELSRLGERRVSSAAVVVLDNASGEVLAYQGSGDFFDEAVEGENDGVQMRRQPGSALKPFAYAEALSAGFTPATVLPDVEVHFADQKGDYTPKNYDRRSHGPVRLREALANSYNVPAVRIAEALGPARLLNVLRAAGFDTLQEGAEHYGLGLVLGDGEVSLWDAARAYGGLSRGGVLRSSRPVLRALRGDGSALPIADELQPRRFLESSSVALVTDILSDNSARSRAFGLDNALRLPFPVAAKTGTSKGYSDNWTLGFTKERTVGVWAGNFDGTPMVQVSGITGAGPIFKRVMTAAMRDVTPLPLLDRARLETVRICPVSGERAGGHCPAAMEEIFARGTGPKGSCQMHQAVAEDLPPELAARCVALAGEDHRVLDLGADYYEWERAEGRSEEPWLAAACAGRGAGAVANGPPRFLYPTAGADFLLFPDLPLADQSIPLRVRAAAEEGPLEVRVDGRSVLTLEAPYTGRLPATKGEHVLALYRRGDARALATSSFRVRSERSDW